MSDKAKRLTLLIATVLMTLFAAEVVLRLTDYGAVRPELDFGVNTRMALDRGSFLVDRDLFWKLPAMASDRSMRAVQPDTPVPPKGRLPRILVIGDSCSRISRAIPPYSVLLEDSLRAAGMGVEVWNASVPGYTSYQGRVWLDKQLLDLDPDVAILYFGWNDHWRSTGVTDEQLASRLHAPLRLMRLLARRPKVPSLRVTRSQYRANLTAMVEALQARNCAVVLIAAPSHITGEAARHLAQTGYILGQDNPVALHRAYLGVLREVAEASGATVLEAGRLMDGLDDPRGLILRDGIHLTDSGHKVLAALLTEVCAPALASGAPRIEPAVLAARARAAYGAGSVGKGP